MPKKNNTVAARPRGLNAKVREIDARSREADIRTRSTESQLRELGAFIRETGVQMRKETAELKSEVGKLIKEMRAHVRELREDDKKILQRVERTEAARGRAVEAMFRKAIPAVLAQAGLHIDQVEPRRLRKEDREYDFVARNGQANFVGEVKTRFKASDLAQLFRLLMKFRADYPDKAGDRAVYGVVCGLTVDDDAAVIARREGLLVVEGQTAAELRVKPRNLKDYRDYGDRAP